MHLAAVMPHAWVTVVLVWHCRTDSLRDEPFQCLSVPVPASLRDGSTEISLEECLLNYSDPTHLPLLHGDESSGYECRSEMCRHARQEVIQIPRVCAILIVINVNLLRPIELSLAANAHS